MLSSAISTCRGSTAWASCAACANKIRIRPEVIMLTGQATVESAIEAMKLGAYDYLTKPYRIAELSALVDQAAEKQS